MRFPASIDALLATLPEGSDERTLFRNLFDIIHGLDLEHTERAGMAVVCALELTEVVFRDGRTLRPLEAGIEDMCNVVAVELFDVQPNPIVWKSRYPGYLTDRSFQADGDRMKARIAKLPFVRSVG